MAQPRTLTHEPLTAGDVARAPADLRSHLPPSPLRYSRAFTAKAGCHVHLKIEGVQPTRAIKVRGALTRLLRMPPEQRAKGVITASAGNHGQGVAHAAQVFQTPATERVVVVLSGANITEQVMVHALRAR